LHIPNILFKNLLLLFCIIGLLRSVHTSSLAEYLLIFFVQSSFFNFGHTTRLRVMLTITLSELMSDVQVAQMRPDGSMEESGEARRLRKSLEEVADESNSEINLLECGLPPTSLNVVQEGSAENKLSWPEVNRLSQCLILALDAGLDHALLVSIFASYFVS
jgi:dedicator of cytokinesis protein 6/7/8